MTNSLQKRFWLIVLTACLTVIAIFAEFFICTHLDHDCVGDACSICLQIEVAQHLLEKLGRLGAMALLAFALGNYTKILVKLSVVFCSSITPVSLKIKINT
ncbi:MAG: hypothetical protein LBK25_08005 [Treponema sp.]|jgi:hypothetical protein|nr:hypothetical protein [Treponema sp.]